MTGIYERCRRRLYNGKARMRQSLQQGHTKVDAMICINSVGGVWMKEKFRNIHGHQV